MAGFSLALWVSACLLEYWLFCNSQFFHSSLCVSLLGLNFISSFMMKLHSKLDDSEFKLYIFFFFLFSYITHDTHLHNKILVSDLSDGFNLVFNHTLVNFSFILLKWILKLAISVNLKVLFTNKVWQNRRDFTFREWNFFFFLVIWPKNELYVYETTTLFSIMYTYYLIDSKFSAQIDYLFLF